MIADDRLAVTLAESLVKLDIALPEDWKKAERDPTSYLRITLERWIEAHGGAAIRRRFLLTAAISTVPCEWAERDESQCDRLFLTVEPSEAGCGCVVLGPTLEMLEKYDSRLPATFFHLLVGALNCWTRTYDYRDAEERVETLREWIAAEPDADQYELPDVAGCIPPCMRHLRPRVASTNFRASESRILSWIRASSSSSIGGCISAQAERPEISEDVRQLLCDCNPPLPSLVAMFAESDAVAACVDDEAQGMMEVTPEPNLIIAFRPSDAASAHSAFRPFAVACETLAAASRLVDLMPGNDKYVISG